MRMEQYLTFTDHALWEVIVNDLEQTDTDNLEEIDLKWQVAMLTMRVKRFIKKIGRMLDLNGKQTVGCNRTKVECYNCHRKGHFTRECRAPRNQGNRNRDTLTKNAPVDTYTTNALVVQDGIGYQIGLESLEARIVVHEKNEAVYEEDIAFLKYDVQSEVLNNVVDSYESDGDDNQVNNRFKKGEGYHAVPPPCTRNYMPPRADLSFAGLDNYVFKSKVRETITSVPKIETNASKTSKDSMEKSKTIRSSAPLIEEHESDSEDKNVFKPKEVMKTVKPSLEKIDIINARNTDVENENKVEKPKKFSQNPRGNKRNWNGLMTHKLGDRFEFKKKACFVCGSVNHLIKDCDFYENKIVLNNKRKITGPKEIRPVWDNTARVNHENKLSHPHPKRNFVPAAVLTKSGQVPVNAAKQSSHKAATLVSAARRVNTVASRQNVNNTLPTTYSYFKAHSPVNNVTTVGSKEVVSAVEGNRNKAVKSSACWIWRPKRNLIDHISKDSGSYTLKRFNYVDPQGRLKSIIKKLMVDLLHLEEMLKEVKLLEKVKSRKLDFEEVHFVKELKFNLFSASQMCDKKNSVLFTDTECVVLSSGFKLLDESKVLLKVPKNNNIYNFDLKNVVLVEGIENQMDHKVKTIKCDNRTKFKNRIMNEFCEMNGIRTKFSVARTPQQNGVIERKNRTLIEAAKTMLADSKLPTTFWAKVGNTSCYVQNRC
uniref:Ribonuclease H-like domain-containing protein n=1 Tax=Tanacetum cinerariifolium TaxID=118510 RepID=A0A6L2IZW9_TANCI|nr:ribonuclease H-like domain-containing protein [Tanacetum cinerariifolium]